MHLYKKNKLIPNKGVILMIVIFVFFLAFFYSQIGDLSKEMSSSNVDAVSQAIENAVITCYAIEGSYPESIEYIEKHYGVVIDYDRFYVDYSIIAGNVKPAVAVYIVKSDN